MSAWCCFPNKGVAGAVAHTEPTSAIAASNRARHQHSDGQPRFLTIRLAFDPDEVLEIDQHEVLEIDQRQIGLMSVNALIQHAYTLLHQVQFNGHGRAAEASVPGDIRYSFKNAQLNG
jgi:hypothetical protein